MFSALKIARETVDEFTEASGRKIDESKSQAFESCCDYIDTLVFGFKGSGIEFSVDADALDIIVRITLSPYFEVEGRQHDFYGLALYAKSFAFEGANDGDNIVAEYRLPGVWA